MFSCNLRILFIRQRNEGINVAQHVWVVLLCNAISEYHVAVAVATPVKALDVTWHCNILLIECLPPPSNVCKYCLGTHTIVIFFWGETSRKFMELGDEGWAVSFHVCINSMLIFSSVVLCSQYRISLWHCREKVNPTLVTCIIMCSNVRICYCFLIGEKRHH